MNRQPMNLQRQLMKRKGLTLIEMLIAITVLAILGGMLMAGLFPMLNRANEMAVSTELSQIDSTINQFQLKYGFYPPSFVQFQNLSATIPGPGLPSPRAALMKRYLNRISPNHQETNARIDAWFSTVGNNIDPSQGHDIVFWLSGLFKDKQFPLTGSASGPALPAFSIPSTGAGRELFCDFRENQMVPSPSNANVAAYSQSSKTFSPLIYIDSASYRTEVTGAPSLQVANWSNNSRRRVLGYWRRTNGSPDTAEPTVTELDGGAVKFENPQTYQLFFAGADAICGHENSGPTFCAMGFNVRNLLGTDSDNIANFANGRLDNYSNSLND